MKKGRAMAWLTAGVLAASLLAGCGGGGDATTAAETTESAAETSTEVAAETSAESPEEESSGTAALDPEENYDTGDASLDNPRNQDEIGDTELLVVSFGTSYNDSRRLTIGAIEEAMEEAFPDYSVRRAFTSQIIIDHVASRDGETIDNVEEALERAIENGVQTLVVQPTHLMNGLEYEELMTTLAEYSDSFSQVAVGEPLLTSEEDFQTVLDAVVEATSSYDDGETAIVFMGHGTEHEANSIYATLQSMFTEQGYENYYIGTVEASPSLDDVLAAVGTGEYTRVVLQPLMVVAGDHANNDMAGEEEGSWKLAFEDAGYQVECVLDGLGQLEAVQQLFVDHAQTAIDSLK